MVQTATNLTLEECEDALYQVDEKAEQFFLPALLICAGQVESVRLLLPSRCKQDGHQEHRLWEVCTFLSSLGAVWKLPLMLSS